MVGMLSPPLKGNNCHGDFTTTVTQIPYVGKRRPRDAAAREASTNRQSWSVGAAVSTPPLSHSGRHSDLTQESLDRRAVPCPHSLVHSQLEYGRLERGFSLAPTTWHIDQ